MNDKAERRSYLDDMQPDHCTCSTAHSHSEKQCRSEKPPFVSMTYQNRVNIPFWRTVTMVALQNLVQGRSWRRLKR
jgi:hypothetical protein